MPVHLGDLVVPAAIAGALLLGGGLLTVLASRRQAPVVVSASPRRAARDRAVVAGIRLAVEMARVDHEVHGAELEAIHDFLTTRVKRRDVPYAARMIRAALDAARDDATVDAAIRELVDLDVEQQRMVVRLLAFVARADGRLRDEELGFLRRVGDALALARDEVDALVRLDDPSAG